MQAPTNGGERRTGNPDGKSSHPSGERKGEMEEREVSLETQTPEKGNQDFLSNKVGTCAPLEGKKEKRPQDLRNPREEKKKKGRVLTRLLTLIQERRRHDCSKTSVISCRAKKNAWDSGGRLPKTSEP